MKQHSAVRHIRQNVGGVQELTVWSLKGKRKGMTKTESGKKGEKVQGEAGRPERGWKRRRGRERERGKGREIGGGGEMWEE